MDLSSQRERVRAFLNTSLRVWSTAGFDDAHSLFVEALDFAGNPQANLPRRGRVQARQVYVYALAGRCGFDRDGQYLALAKRASDAAERVYRHAGGGWIFSADSDGAAAVPSCFAYEQSFRIMSLAALCKATGNAAYAEQAERSWQWIESLRDPVHGGFHLGQPRPDAPREQNPHMHLFEASLEARGIDPALWDPRADELYRLAIGRFVARDGALVEFFSDDWRPDPEKGADIQPGHHFEWVWLLTQYEKICGEPIAAIDKLYRTGAAWGLDSAGLGFDEVRPGGAVLRGTKRLWVQCEVLKGHLARYELTGNERCMEGAMRSIEGMFAHYLIESNGAWYDQIDESNRNISANAPASSLYHVLIALNEFLRVTEPAAA